MISHDKSRDSGSDPFWGSALELGQARNASTKPRSCIADKLDSQYLHIFLQHMKTRECKYLVSTWQKTRSFMKFHMLLKKFGSPKQIIKILIVAPSKVAKTAQHFYVAMLSRLLELNLISVRENWKSKVLCRIFK